MRMKNWVYSLFQENQVLYDQGFRSVQPTPGIEVGEKSVSPDIIAWNDTTVIIFENKSGKPDSEKDVNQAKKYLNIPLEILRELTNLQIQETEVVLLYFEENLQDNRDLKEELFRKAIMERKLVIWTLDKTVGRIRLVYGDHSNSNLNSLLKRGIPIELLAPSRIFVQPNSPSALLSRELFVRLLSWSFKERDKEFTLQTTIEIFKNQFFAFSDSEKHRKLRDAIKTGENLNLCKQKTPETWRLTLNYGNPEEFLEKLNQFLKQGYFKSNSIK